MDALMLSAKVNQGNGKAAKRLGRHSATLPGNITPQPLKSTTAAGTLRIIYHRFRLYAAVRFGQAARIGIFDATGFEAGDILVSGEGTYFVAAMPLLQPILCVKTERLVSIRRTAQASNDAGLQDYGGTTAANEKLIMADWPASILLSRSSEHSPLKLPGETRSALHNILMPAFRGVSLHAGDFITDEAGHRFVISSTELTDMGWRLTALQVTI